jgi:hypothetical protein
MHHESERVADPLDRLVSAHPPPGPPAGFTARVMARVNLAPAPAPPWARAWVQWLALGVGMVFALGRLGAFVFGVWTAATLGG